MIVDQVFEKHSVRPTRLEKNPLWRDLIDVLRLSGASDLSIVRAQESRDTIRALARIVERRTGMPLNSELFREPQANLIHSLPEQKKCDVAVAENNLVRGLLYAGCSVEQLKQVKQDQVALNEIVQKIMLYAWTKAPSPYLLLDEWLPVQPLYTVTCVTEEEGKPLLDNFVREGKVTSELKKLYAQDSVEWATWRRRNRLHTMSMVLSRALVSDQSNEAVTPSEQSLIRMFMRRYNGFGQGRTPASFGIAPLLDCARLERFVIEHELNWVRILHRPIFNERNVGSIVMLRFGLNGKLKQAEAVDAYENPRFDANGAFALLVH